MKEMHWTRYGERTQSKEMGTGLGRQEYAAYPLTEFHKRKLETRKI